MNHDNKPLGPAGINNWLASRVADGTGTPDEARELISEVSQSIASWARGIVCVLAASGLQVRLLYGKLGGDGDWLELADSALGQRARYDRGRAETSNPP